MGVGENLGRAAARPPPAEALEVRAIGDVNRNVAGAAVVAGRDLDLIAGELATQLGRLPQ